VITETVYATLGTGFRTNLCPNPSSEVDVTGWSLWAGTGGAVTATRETSGGEDGSAFFRGTWTAAAAANTGGSIAPTAPVVGLTPYTMSVWVRPSSTRILTAQYQFFNGATATGGGAGTPVSCPAGVWTQVYVVGTSAASDTTVQLRAYATSDATGFPIGFTLDSDACLIEANAPDRNYFAGALATGSPTVPVLVDPTTAWVMDPEDPTNAMLLPLKVGTNAQVGHQSAGAAVLPLQGLPIWLGGPRTLLSRAFVISTLTTAEATQFAQMIAPGGVLLIRPPATMRHDTGLIYVGVGSIPEAAWIPAEAPADWTIDGTEVADDGWPTVVAERTWMDLEAECATWLDVEAMYATWLAVEQG